MEDKIKESIDILKLEKFGGLSMTTLEKAQIEKAKSLIRFCHEQQYGCRKCIFADLDTNHFEDCKIEYPCSWELPEE